MKLQLISDIHLEFQAKANLTLEMLYGKMEEVPDIIVLAGDIITLKNAELFDVFKTFCDHAQYVLYVPGNHEYYGTSFKKGKLRLNALAAEFPNLFILDNGVVDLEGQKFVGSTMWFQRNETTWVYEDMLNDFRAIKDFKYYIGSTNMKAVGFLEQNVTSDSIVITHHLPAEESVAGQFKGDPFNCFYVNDMSKLIQEKQPSFWFHGHTHNACMYTLGRTQVFANPLDYPPNWTANIDAKFQRIIEV